VKKLFKSFVAASVEIVQRLVVLFLVIFLTGCATQAPQTNKAQSPIRSTGVGGNLSDAKEQAFKQAIDNRIGVLVLSERDIQTYRLLKDEILTYSAGYIDDYNIVSQEKVGKKWVVTADVWVSSSKLTGRIISFASSDGRINGKKASDSFNSFVKQKEQADRLTEKVLSGFPENALIPKYTHTELKFDHNRNAQLLVHLQTSWNKSYLTSLKELLNLVQDGGGASQFGAVQVMYKDDESDWFPSSERYKFSDTKLYGRFTSQFSNGHIALRLKLRDGTKTVFEDCWNVPDQYAKTDSWGNVSILGHMQYESVITLTIPYQSNFQKILEASSNVVLAIERAEKCQKLARGY
jgi:hypothetical protein